MKRLKCAVLKRSSSFQYYSEIWVITLDLFRMTLDSASPQIDWKPLYQGCKHLLKLHLEILERLFQPIPEDSLSFFASNFQDSFQPSISGSLDLMLIGIAIWIMVEMQAWVRVKLRLALRDGITIRGWLSLAICITNLTHCFRLSRHRAYS